ncbi:MAG: hypothetical protein E7508_03650 [Ruminococcus sp.]|nr:hypothetical protein [Ruminococcus sp.]
MKKLNRLISVAAVIACTAAFCRSDGWIMETGAASTLQFDYTKIDENPQNQFYYSDQDEFYVDGITVYYNNEDVTSQVSFSFSTTPETTYDGKNIDYVIPFTATYNDISVDGCFDAKIGLRGDANCDGKVTLNDLVLIQNDLKQSYNTGKSSLTANDSFGIFLSNADGRHADGENSPYGSNLLNVGDAFFISSYLNGKGKGSMYNNILLNNAIKLTKGEITVSDCNVKAGEIINVPVSQVTDGTLGAFEITCEWGDSGLIPLGVVSPNAKASVFSVIKNDSMKIWGFGNNDALSNGEFVYLQFQVPNSAAKGEKYSINISNIDYFGTGVDISDYVVPNSGTITVSEESENPDAENLLPVTDEAVSYDYAVKAWDAVVEYGSTEATVPVMLLSGLETNGLILKVQCDAPLSIDKLENALMITESSDGGYTGVYESDTNLQVDFETLNVKIAANTAPGTYPVRIAVESVNGMEDVSELVVLNGSVTIKEKSIVKGDANCDNALTVSDAAYIARTLAKRETIDIESNPAADYNGDGKVTVADAAAIARYLAKRK